MGPMSSTNRHQTDRFGYPLQQGETEELHHTLTMLTEETWIRFITFITLMR